MNYSKQRDTILSFLRTRRDHPTAEIIYGEVRKALPNVSLGTVYRNLNLLADNGLIRRIDCGDDMVHFDADMSPHQHIVCDSCGSVEDILLDTAFLNEQAGKMYNGEVTFNDVIFHGKCSHCKSKDVAHSAS